MRQIISRAPLRVSFVGGGTDRREWFEKQNGAVVSAAIQQYVYVSVRRLPSIFDFNFRIVTSRVEQVNTLDEIEQPIVREVLRFLANPNDRLEIVYNADLPGKSGMGSSSSFAVACIEAVSSFYNRKLNKAEIAELAIKIERDILKEAGGLQDQIAAAYGGINKIKFSRSKFEVESIELSENQIEKMQKTFFLVFTKFIRTASKVEARKTADIENFNIIHKKIYEQVDDFHKEILSEELDVSKLGEFLSQNWQFKKQLDRTVSNKVLDQIYNQFLNCGVKGGKLLGAGSGGFFLFAKDKSYIPSTQIAEEFFLLPFTVDFTGVCTIYRNL